MAQAKDGRSGPEGDGSARRVAVLGASGYIGAKVVQALCDESWIGSILALDVRSVPPAPSDGRCHPVTLDVRSPQLKDIFARHDVDTVVHLASVVTPPRGMTAQEQYAIDVDGTHNVVESCLVAGVRHLVITSSGAAYGYHHDNPAWIDESRPLRGNDAFPYARHKRLVEEMLARYRATHPELLQLVFRPGTVIGRGTHNQITALFERPILLAVAGGDSRFVFIRDDDVVACIVRGVRERRTGIFNLAGDGAMDARDIARVTGARVLTLPAGLLAMALGVGRALGLTRHGPEHVPFLQYRPVLSNARLREEFGFVPTRTTREAFLDWWHSRQEGVRS